LILFVERGGLTGEETSKGGEKNWGFGEWN